MGDETKKAVPPPPDRREIIDVSPEDFEESQAFLMSPDAIMDDSVFNHIKKVISYLYRKEIDIPDNSGTSADLRKSEYLAELNTNVLNMLVDGYVGYSWLCEVCARWIEELNVKHIQYLSIGGGVGEKREGGSSNYSGTTKIIQEALMSFLTKNYDSEKMRIYMEDKADHDKWNPPELYWNLMKSPLVVSNMIKIYRERPKDEFLSSWYQDYINNASVNMKLEQTDIDKEALSRITSNFSVFTLRISEEIVRFLLTDDVLDSIELENSSPLSPLFCHAENAYIYSQALLHFIYQWRIDLRGCRRLSQLIARATMYPHEGLFPDEVRGDEKMCEWSASQIHLLMTNFSRFPNLHKAYKRLCRNQKMVDFKLNALDVCDFYDELNKTLNAFENYGILLFDQSRDKHGRNIVINPDLEDVDDSVSQFGDIKRSDEYMRLRNAPEMPPLEAIRESHLLNKLIEDFANEDISLPDSNTWIRYANLLVLLSVSSPYEMLYAHYDEISCDYLRKLPQREVWKEFYLPDGDDDSSLEEIENIRDYGANFKDNNDGSSELYSLHPYSSDHDGTSEYSGSSVEKAISNEMSRVGIGKVVKAWNYSSVGGSITTDSDSYTPRSALSSSAFESELCHNMETKSTSESEYMGGKVRVDPVYTSEPSHQALGDKHALDVSDANNTEGRKRRRVTYAKDVPYDNAADEFLEIKSTLASAIYKNTSEDSRLGAPRNISQERITEMKGLFSSFKIQSDKVKGIARRELYHLYKLIHTPSLKSHERDLEMRDVISTNIASSVVMAYIRHTIVKKRNIEALCNAKMLLLKEIADKHAAKRTPIVIFLRDVCVACANGKITATSSSIKLERLEFIAELLVYIARFERQSIPIVCIFNSIMHQVDRSISRHFLSTLLCYCGAPYSEEFLWHLLQLVEKFLTLGNIGSSTVPHEKEMNVINNFLRPLVQECMNSWSSQGRIMDIANKCKELMNC
ncbi:negative elongation factor D like protein [Babesia gibsoni]|uniref:Negative elongation factor D like protein n=1 Tax=Babesia gibsoni TaxID=33632 RepID=A0AAD8PDY3_BABGI|nr:negative elongation factor D like protein [Babesia gibsoni]